MTNTKAEGRVMGQSAIQFLVFVCCAVMFVCMFMATNIGIAYCADETTPATPNAADVLVSAITDGTQQVYNMIRAITIPILIVTITFAGVSFLIGGRNGTENARKIAIGSFVGVVIIVFAPVLGQTVGSWFANVGTGDFSEYNPLRVS